MSTKFAFIAVFSVCVFTLDFAAAQNRIPARPISYRAPQTKVVNIFSLPQDSAPASSSGPVQEAPSTQQTDPFSDLPKANSGSQGTQAINKDNSRPSAAESADPIFDPFSEPQPKPELNDMPLNVDPFADLTAPQELKSIEAPAQDLEVLPAPTQKEPADHSFGHSTDDEVTVGGGVSWMNLNSPMPPQQLGTSYKRNHNRGLTTSVYRRPTPPTPTINVLHPAIIHVPVHIQVLPSYVGYPYFAPYPAYFVPKQPPKSVYDSSDYYGNPEPRADNRLDDYSYRLPTDQRVRFSQDPNVVGYNSGSVNYVGYPLNYFSYPSSQSYGLHIQSFPVTRRLDR